MNLAEVIPMKVHTEFIQYERLSIKETWKLDIKYPIWSTEEEEEAWYQAFLKNDLQTLRSVIKDLLADCISKREERTWFKSLIKAEKALIVAMDKLEKLPRSKQKTHEDEFWAYSDISDMLEAESLLLHSEYRELGDEDDVYWGYA